MKTLTTLLLLLFITNPTTAQQKELTKQQSINYIKSYYANFKTGSFEYVEKDGNPKLEEVKKYRQYTGNYKVVIEGCKFKISYDEISWPNDCTTIINYDIYNWSDASKKDRKIIEFKLNEIDSISSGNKERGESEIINGNIRFHSSKNIKTTTVPVIRNQFSGKAKYLVDLKINDESKEENDFSNIEIVKAFQRLVVLCKMN
nr:hypothetical protein [uncultured Flavobacterium sp.]